MHLQRGVWQWLPRAQHLLAVDTQQLGSLRGELRAQLRRAGRLGLQR